MCLEKKNGSFFFPSRLSQGHHGPKLDVLRKYRPIFQNTGRVLPTPAKEAWAPGPQQEDSHATPSVYIHAVISRTRPSPTYIYTPLSLAPGRLLPTAVSL
jgi:hypothetical protein